MKRKSETISFRADEQLMRVIDEQRQSYGISRGDFVRGVVLGHVYQTRETEINERFIELADEVRQCQLDISGQRSLLRRMLLSMLSVVEGVTPDKAKAIVAKVFAEEQSGSDSSHGRFNCMHEG